MAEEKKKKVEEKPKTETKKKTPTKSKKVDTKKPVKKTETKPKTKPAPKKVETKKQVKKTKQKIDPAKKAPAKKTAEKKPSAKPKEEKKDKEVEAEEEAPKEDKEEYKAKKKPELSKEQKEKLRVRKQIKKRTPKFLREEWFRYKRIPKNWRRPDGITSKMRINLKYRPSKVRVGFRGPKDTRGLHSSGFEEIIVNNVNDLENINPKTQAARIGSTVGTKKRIDIEKKAQELDVRILNM